MSPILLAMSLAFSAEKNCWLSDGAVRTSSSNILRPRSRFECRSMMSSHERCTMLSVDPTSLSDLREGRGVSD